MAAAWYAIVDGKGEAVSFGTVLADPIPDGLSALPIDGPPGDRLWNAKARRLEDPPPPPSPDVAAGDEADRLLDDLDPLVVDALRERL